MTKTPNLTNKPIKMILFNFTFLKTKFGAKWMPNLDPEQNFTTK